MIDIEKIRQKARNDKYQELIELLDVFHHLEDENEDLRRQNKNLLNEINSLEKIRDHLQDRVAGLMGVFKNLTQDVDHRL